MGFIQWFTAWSLLIVIGIALSKTTPGAKVVHYVIWLSIVLILVTRYKEIASIFTIPGTNQATLLIQGQQ